MEKKKLNKTTKSNLITYGMVLAAYLIVQGMIAGNLLSNLMQGLLVPLCVYIILALSLNLTVGILGGALAQTEAKLAEWTFASGYDKTDDVFPLPA